MLTSGGPPSRCSSYADENGRRLSTSQSNYIPMLRVKQIIDSSARAWASFQPECWANSRKKDEEVAILARLSFAHFAYTYIDFVPSTSSIKGSDRKQYPDSRRPFLIGCRGMLRLRRSIPLGGHLHVTIIPIDDPRLIIIFLDCMWNTRCRTGIVLRRAFFF